jgi:hypothetical protein
MPATTTTTADPTPAPATPALTAEMICTPKNLATARRYLKWEESDPRDARRLAEECVSILGEDGWQILWEAAEAQPATETDSLYRESEQSPNTLETGSEQRFAAPIRKEDWIESEDYPGIWINSSGEVMDGATRKVRTLSTSFNPKTRKFSTRVWLNTEHGYCYHMNLLTERERLRKAT